MKIFISALFLSLALPLCARAYIPPCSFMLKKMTTDRPAKHGALVYVSIYKPAETNKESDALLSEQTLFFNPEQPVDEGAWPTLSLMLETNGERLIQSLRGFGLRLPEEKDLIRARRDQLLSMKDMPNPFYQREQGVSLHRYRKNSYVWACEEESSRVALWIEKDSFVPALIRGPCPATLGENSTCSVELQNAWRLSEAKNARMIIRKDDKLKYLVKIEHVILNPSAAQWKAAKDHVQQNLAINTELAPFFH